MLRFLFFFLLRGFSIRVYSVVNFITICDQPNSCVPTCVCLCLMCVRAFVRLYACVCPFVCVYVPACVCLCVCARISERVYLYETCCMRRKLCKSRLAYWADFESSLFESNASVDIGERRGKTLTTQRPGPTRRNLFFQVILRLLPRPQQQQQQLWIRWQTSRLPREIGIEIFLWVSFLDDFFK